MRKKTLSLLFESKNLKIKMICHSYSMLFPYVTLDNVVTGWYAVAWNDASFSCQCENICQ
jgi:hypothetical protein